MSINNVDTSFVNVSVGPYIIDQFWVNTKGFTAGRTGDTLVLPGLYDQGASILSCSLICPDGSGAVGVLGDGAVRVVATGNAAPGVVLYSAVGTGVFSPSGGLGATLPQDSWLQLSFQTGATVVTAAINQPIGLCVKWTKLTETQNSYGL